MPLGCFPIIWDFSLKDSSSFSNVWAFTPNCPTPLLSFAPSIAADQQCSQAIGLIYPLCSGSKQQQCRENSQDDSHTVCLESLLFLYCICKRCLITFSETIVAFYLYVIPCRYRVIVAGNYSLWRAISDLGLSEYLTLSLLLNITAIFHSFSSLYPARHHVHPNVQSSLQQGALQEFTMMQRLSF